MKLQIAIDVVDDKKAIKLAKKVHKFADILEIGTPLIKKHGIMIIKKMRKIFPKKL